MDEIRQAELVEQIAARIHRWGLGALAGVVLDVARPLAFVGGQALWVAQPALGTLMGREQVAEYAQLLERPEALTLLRAQLEGN